MTSTPFLHVFAAPGEVSELEIQTEHSFIVLTWNIPQDPNGVIIGYEVTYRINSSNIVTINTTHLSTSLTISSLTPHTRISSISVSAYNTIGRGRRRSHKDIILGMCFDVQST